jgi:hypothetical protein
MQVLIIQPPTPSAVLLDQAGGRVAHISPPWPAACLLSFLRQRTRHTGRIFDARIRARWEQDLANNIATRDPVHLVAIHCRQHDADAIRAVVGAVRRISPELPIAGFGDIPTMEPSTFRQNFGMDYGIVGDPEPTLRHLLDNFVIAFRRQRIPALVQEGGDIATPLWVSDLKTLALPIWGDTSLSSYESPAFPGGTRVDFCISRGSGKTPIEEIARPGKAPLRIGPLDSYAEELQRSTHIGILEMHFADPPEVWDGGRLAGWLDRLERMQNAQDWSLRLLAMPIGHAFRERLVQQRCRRIEMLVPSTSSDLAARFGYEIPDHREMREMIDWFQRQNVTIDLIFWIGDPDEPREARRIFRFIKALRFCPFALETRPDLPARDPHALDIARDVRRRIALSPGRRIRNFFARAKNLRVTIDIEHRDLIARHRPAAQTHDGDEHFQSLEKSAPQTSNHWKT